MDGWEIFGYITLGVIGLGILFSVVPFFRGRDIGLGGAIPPLATIIFAISNFIPFGMLMFGFIADLIGQEFRYSISSIVGILTMIVNKFVSYLAFDRRAQPVMVGGATQGWCAIPGFELLEARTLPMSTAVTSAIAVYYMYAGFTNRPTSQNISISAGLGVFLLANVLTMGASGCSEYYYPAFGGSFLTNLVLATILGGACGAISSVIVESFFPDMGPFANVKNLPPGTTATGLQSKGGVGSPATGGTCQPVVGGEEDAMVCEAYRNGQLVTDRLT